MENLQEPILTPLLLDNPPETYSWKVTAKQRGRSELSPAAAHARLKEFKIYPETKTPIYLPHKLPQPGTGSPSCLHRCNPDSICDSTGLWQKKP